jgi:hypothetical protein
MDTDEVMNMDMDTGMDIDMEIDIVQVHVRVCIHSCKYPCSCVNFDMRIQRRRTNFNAYLLPEKING